MIATPPAEKKSVSPTSQEPTPEKESDIEFVKNKNGERELIGKGAFAKVVRAKYHWRDLAVKVFRVCPIANCQISQERWTF